MDSFEITRTTKFVSLDTHPANNALVLTYDILSIATDAISGRELSRASKRHQQLVQITLLDKLNVKDLQTNKLAIDLNGLSSEIIRQCPLLSSDSGSSRKRPGQNVEDIKLHLLYLINRRQAQNQSQRHANPNDNPSDRPKSLAIRRRPGSALAKRQASATIRDSGLHNYGDVYIWVLDKPRPIQLEAQGRLFDKLTQHLEEIRLNFQIEKESTTKQVDSHLDALYGDQNEKFEALIKLQQLHLDNNKLFGLAEKRLLVCALVRTLADIHHQTSGEENDNIINELVLCCLISLTNYHDIYQQAFRERNNVNGVDLVGAHLGSLAGFVGRLLRESKIGDKICLDNYFYLASGHLILLGNLIQLEFKQVISNSLSNHLFISLSGILQLLSSQLSHDFRTMAKSDKLERNILQLVQVLFIIKRLTISREFINYVRGPKMTKKKKNLTGNNTNTNIKTDKQLRQADEQQQQQIIDQSPCLDSLICLVNRLQMSRPGSGQAQSTDVAMITDRSLLNEIYELELLAFRVIANLMVDRRVRLKLIKKGVLKCLLRNLVSLLASRNNLASFNKSKVLIIPLDCLYRLTCEQSVLNELFKSKLILRCLFEYLLNSGSTFLKSLDENRTYGDSFSIKNDGPARPLIPMTEIKLDPNCADHFLLSIWCNMTSRNEYIMILNSDSNLALLQSEYVNLVARLVSVFCKQQPITNDDSRLLIYLHLKLIANMSKPVANSSLLCLDDQLIEKLAIATTTMMDQLDSLSPLIIESLWTISNLVLTGDATILKQNNSDIETGKRVICPEPLLNLMQRLFTFNQTDFETETDDDLLLVSCIYTAIVAQNREICNTKSLVASGKNYQRVMKATNFLLSSKSSDNTILFACLFTLIRLTNHHECCTELASQLVSTGQSNGYDDLLPKLSSYMLVGEQDIANLACTLIDRLVQMSQLGGAKGAANGLSIRFAAYNAKWLQAIQASRNELMTTPDEDPETDNWLDDERELLEDAAELDTNQRSSASSMSRTGLLGSVIRDLDEADLDDEEEFDEPDDDVTSRSSANAPDFNVVDPNSMIKHLISRQKSRAQYSQQ